VRIALAQINPTVGDIAGNAGLIETSIDRARDAQADLVVFPELAMCGYPPKDLLLREGFVAACAREAKRIGESRTAGLTAVIGTPLPVGDDHPGALANSLVVYRDNAFVDYYDKRLLPTYDVFDEDRYFEPGTRAVVVEVSGVRVGLAICEDLWKGEDAGFSSRYLDAPDPVRELVEAGARVVVAPSASPFVLHKGKRHHELLTRHAREHSVAVASVNQIGGNDDLVFEGHSTVHAPGGTLVAAAPGFVEHLLVADVPMAPVGPNGCADPRLTAPGEELVFRALVLGVGDYMRKTGFGDAIVGLSGGIDSAVTAAVGVAALGADHVTGVAMPGKYSSQHSIDDALDLARRLGIACPVVPIAAPFDGFRGAIDPLFEGLGHAVLGAALPDLAEENLQSRVRGSVLMALSNRSGAIVLTTGNKSEVAVGYCTLYGDMNGGLAVLSDVTKTLVYRLARWINANHAACGFASAPIPERTIDKPPSAELAPDQLDTDSLPPYDVLDEIVERRVERHQSVATIVGETGFDEPVVRRIARLIDVNEYKRKQMATGIKVTGVAFGQGRRVPIAQRWGEP